MGLFSRTRRRILNRAASIKPSPSELEFHVSRGSSYSSQRVATLYRAKAKKEDLIKAHPNSDKVRGWLKSISEYLESIDNLNSGRPDGYTGNPIGVVIGAPKLGA